MAVVLVKGDIADWLYWHCTDCGWESVKFRKADEGPDPGHACRRRPVRPAEEGDAYLDDTDDLKG